MKRLKILLISQNYHPYIGGVEVHARQVAQELQRSGHEVTVAAMNFAPPTLPDRLRIFHTNLFAPSYASYHDGTVAVKSLSPTRLDRIRLSPLALRAVPLVRRFADRKSNRVGYRVYRAVYVAKLKRLMNEIGADVVHSLAGDYLGWAAQAAATELGISFVCTPFVHPKQWGDSADDVAYYLRSDAVIGLVPSDAAYLASIGVPQDKLAVIGVSPELPAKIDPDGFRQRHGLVGKPVVLYVGRMMPAKGAPAVLAATGKVWQSHHDARFIFIGPANAAEAAAFNEVDSRIKYLGKVSLQEKADALAACDVFCMPSISEILPTVYLEAWSYGKPVVGGHAHGLPELVEGNQAGMAAAQDGDAIATALNRLLGDQSLRAAMGSRGREMVQTKYSVPAVTDSLLQLYRKAISHGTAGAVAVVDRESIEADSAATSLSA